MYKHLQSMLTIAKNIAGDDLGSIDELGMGVWIPGTDRIKIKGKTDSGKIFELTLEVSECQKSE